MTTEPPTGRRIVIQRLVRAHRDTRGVTDSSVDASMCNVFRSIGAIWENYQMREACGGLADVSNLCLDAGINRNHPGNEIDKRVDAKWIESIR